MSYQIFTDATADIPKALLEGLPNLVVIPMEVLVGGGVYTYGPNGNISVDEFYKMQKMGAFASTSQISPETYKFYFETYIKEGMDVLYLGFSSGMSGTMNASFIARNELKEEYPEVEIICIDTLCGSAGEALLVIEALRRQKEGMDIEELSMWVAANCLNVCHWFTVDTFEHLRHGGRVSNVAAVAGSVLNIKPLLHVDEEGKLKVVEKPRGRKAALRSSIVRMDLGVDFDLGNLVIIAHGDCKDHAQEAKKLILEKYPCADIHITDVGPVIGAHTGPGMMEIIYWGHNR